ncbi:tetratricopeptide repeat protein [Gemmatimonas sp.]|uniref:tetratricopeptide repeat protein n=1 Tax=Gemmatimonas sp. TaxID=1962908 RepID=UPI003561F678
MPPDTPGIGGTPRLLPSLPIVPTVLPSALSLGPVGPVAPSKALAPVAPSGTSRSSMPSSPLARSGLDLLDIFGTTDLLVERRTVAPVALEVGLETARGALLRGLAAESLATLDGVWERAQLTEEGWYLRSGALTVLGLPGEAERVCTAALQRKPSSVALRFMQSVARLADGDVSGARVAMAEAVESPATHPVLLMQQVIVLARQGNGNEAERLLLQVMRGFPDHPAVEFARATLTSIGADHSRSTSRSAFGGRVDVTAPFTTGNHEVFEAFGAATRDTMFDGDDWTVEHAASEHTAIGSDARIPNDDLTGSASDRAIRCVTGNVAERAMARLGAHFATLSVPDVVREGRMLIRALSAGGSMAGACTPEQAHAARGVLTAIVFALTNSAPSARATVGASPLEVLLAQWMPLMQTERFDDAARVLRRLGASIPDAQRRLLAACAHFTVETSPQHERELRVMPLVSGEYEAPVQGEPAKGPLIPVRLGLALLEERSPDRTFERTLNGWIEHPRELTPGHATPSMATPSQVMSSRVTPIRASGGAIETDGRGWGAAPAAGAYLPPPREEGVGMRVAALLCVIIAAGAATSGSGVVAVAFGVGAAWLGLRRSGRSGERPDEARDRDTTGAD